MAPDRELPNLGNELHVLWNNLTPNESCAKLKTYTNQLVPIFIHIVNSEIFQFLYSLHAHVER